MKKMIPCLFIMVLFSCVSLSALAEGNAPASQFGFKGWPYRQSAPCQANGCQSQAACSAARQNPSARPEPSAPNQAPGQNQPSSTGDYTTISVTAQEQKLLNLINQDRANNGLPALAADQELSALARTKSQDMNDNHYFAHESPTYGNAASMLDQFGYEYRGVGENIAHHANVDKAEAAFMSSQGHRANILGSQWTKVGVGVVEDSNGFIYATELFVR